VSRVDVDIHPTHLAVLACLLVAMWLTPSDALAGAWAQKDKGIYAKLSGGYSFATRQYKESGETFQLLSEDERGRFDLYSLLLYTEFGLLPKLTVTMSTSFSSAVVDSNLVNIRTTGLGDVRTGLKYQFLDSPLVMSVGAKVTSPTGYTPDPAAAKAPTLGLGVPMYEGKLLVGKSFYPFPMYVSAEAGFRLRGSRRSRTDERVDYPPEIPYLAEIGVNPVDWLTLRGLVNGVEGLGDPLALDAFSLSPLTQSYTKVGPSVIFTIADRFQINADYLYTVAGINAIRSHDFTVGFAIDQTL
jgi:hypothetical protein